MEAEREKLRRGEDYEWDHFTQQVARLGTNRRKLGGSESKVPEGVMKKSFKAVCTDGGTGLYTVGDVQGSDAADGRERVPIMCTRILGRGRGERQ